jgi:hypothetical protein
VALRGFKIPSQPGCRNFSNNVKCDKILNLLIKQLNQNTDDDCNNDKDVDNDTKIMMTIIVIIIITTAIIAHYRK